MADAPDSLNPAQLEAVHHLRGPCLVLAGAGSGKTRVITHKIARLLQAGLAPKEIAAITFTNKAAQEMRERSKALVGPRAAKDLVVATFHSLVGAAACLVAIAAIYTPAAYGILGDDGHIHHRPFVGRWIDAALRSWLCADHTRRARRRGVLNVWRSMVRSMPGGSKAARSDGRNQTISWDNTVLGDDAAGVPSEH